MTFSVEAGAAVTGLVKQCWAAVLEMAPEDVEGDSNFFAAGGDSLLAVELVAVIGENLGREVPLDPLFFDGTFAALAEACRDIANSTEPGPTAPGS